MRKFLQMTLLACLMPLMSYADDVEIGGIYYTLSGSEATVANQSSDSNTPSGAVTIPSEVSSGGSTYTVTALAGNAFYGNTSITSITLPSSLTSIGTYAFYGCTNLASVDFSAVTKLASIPSNCFYKCSAIEEIEIPEGVTSIASQVFVGEQLGTTMALKTVTLPSTLASIGQSAFQYCPNLTSVTIKATTPPTLNYSFDSGLSATLYVPTESVSAYTNYSGTSGTYASYFNVIAAIGDVVDNTTSGDTTSGEDSSDGFTVTFTPGGGAEVESIHEFTIECETGFSLSKSYASSVTLKDGDGTTVAGVNLDDSYEYEIKADDSTMSAEIGWFYTRYTLTLDKTITDIGTYTLTLPAGMINFYDAEDSDNDHYSTSAYTTTVVIPDPNAVDTNLTYTFDPADGGVTMGPLKQFDVTADGWLDLALNSEAGVIISDEDGTQVTTGHPDRNAYVDNNSETSSTVTIYLSPVVSDAGTYTITIPAGFFYLDENNSTTNTDPITSTFTIATIETDPANEADVTDSLTAVTLTSNVQFVLGGSTSLSDAFVTDLYNSARYAVVSACDIASDGYSCTLVLSAGVSDTPCQLFIPAGYFTFMDEDFTATFFIVEGSSEGGDGSDGNDDTTGISGVAAGGLDAADVYNIAGQRVAAPVRGQVNIVRATDGTVKKVLAE